MLQSVRLRRAGTAGLQEPQIDLVTWVFEEGTFVPCARVTDYGSQSILTDYLGTPVQMYDAKGEKTWEAQLDIYGRVRTFVGRSLSDCPFRYQGQYEDEETGLYYNRFRYYDPSIGSYISQDPIKINGNNPTLYGYVHNPNYWIDVFALIIVYRNIPPGGSISGGISARNPGRGMTPTGHINHGSRRTFKGSQYISATTDPAIVQKWKIEGQLTVCFDTDDVVADAVGHRSVLDVSTPELATSNGVKGKTAINFASSSKEVLIEGYIPENKIKVMNDNEIEMAKKLHSGAH